MILTNILSFLENGLVIIVAFVLGILFRLRGIWLSLPVSSLMLLLGLIAYIWIKNKKISFEEEELILLSDTFRGNSDNNMYINIFGDTDISEILSQIKAFIICHEVNKHDAENFFAYIVELIKHQFKQYNMFNISIIYKENNIIVRIRNNDRDFKPLNISSEYKTEIQTHLGISEVKVSLQTE